VYKQRNGSDEDALREALRRAEAELGKPAQILFVIQEREGQVYNEVKRICDCVLGVQSQLLVAPNIKLGQGQGGQMGRKMAGVALKVNVKLGGDNAILTGNASIWCPAAKKDGSTVPPRVMLLGADVTHPTNVAGGGKADARDPAEAARKPNQPSIASIVGSVNQDCTRFACRIFTQDALSEMVTDMGRAVHELLTVYGKTNNTLPDVIIMFRDGVSEGQFIKCINSELKAIQDACARFTLGKAPYKPKVTFVTVQKRHGTRFFPGEQSAFDLAVGGKSGNVRPGVVVDTDICSPTMFDFYLNSHAGIQGTNKSAKYSVLYDDVGFSADSMQVLAYWLCHTFCRCTRTVSYCPPAYYAHHAAFRGRAWLRREDIASDTVSMASGTSGTGSSGAYRWTFAPAHDALKDTMFWI
jgi:eukaryotic translation initiation factor 2C